MAVKMEEGMQVAVRREQLSAMLGSHLTGYGEPICVTFIGDAIMNAEFRLQVGDLLLRQVSKADDSSLKKCPADFR